MSPTEPIGNRRHFQKLKDDDGYGYTLIDEGVRVEVRHLRREHHQLIGEVDVLCEWAGAHTHNGTGSLSCADLNLSSQAARTARAKYCAERAKSKPGDFDWIGAVDDACRSVIDAERRGSDVIVLDDAPDEGPPDDFKVFGLSIPADSHSQLVTDGGNLKSLVLLLVLGEMAKQGIPVLFVDWEWNAARHKARKRRLFGSERFETLHYLKCHHPITMEQDHIRRFCRQNGIKFVALDSIGAAVEGKLADDDVARGYNRCLDGFPPSLSAAHVPKGMIDPNADQKAFGSAFFHNYARMTWTLRKHISVKNRNLVTVMFSPHKQNDGDPQEAAGLEFTFSQQQILVRGVDPLKVTGLADSLPIGKRMAHLLQDGPLTLAAMAEQLEEKVDSVEKAAKRGKEFIRLPNQSDGVVRYGLVDRRFAVVPKDES
jgi:hypothetical protein